MHAHATGRVRPLAPFEQIRYAREVLKSEGQAILKLATRLDDAICTALDLIGACRGSVIVSGMGKAGLIGQKIAATFASTGTRSHFVHPAEALHGDLGRIGSDDVALLLSQSGETREVAELVGPLAELGVPLVAITCRASSTLARAARVVLDLGPLEEACPLGLAPTTSTTAMLAVGDALAIVAGRMRGLRREDFARLHPGGSLGRKLSRVEEVMRPLGQCRVARECDTVREVFVQRRKPGRRTGAVMLVDDRGRLSGIFTDSDLARLFEGMRESELDQPIANIMTRSPVTVPQGVLLADAVKLLAARKISELPVVDSQGQPVGMIDVTDVVGLMPDGPPDAYPTSPAAHKTPAAALKISPDEHKTPTAALKISADEHKTPAAAPPNFAQASCAAPDENDPVTLPLPAREQSTPGPP